jgi:hypothetical protein
VFTVTGECQQLEVGVNNGEVSVNSEVVSVNSENCVFKARVGS